jgi:Myb-like DNA-binding domain
LDFDWLQGRIERLIWQWNDECFGMKQPHLTLINYDNTARHGSSTGGKSAVPPQTPPPRDQNERIEVLETLKRRRNALKENHGDDPIIESRKIAQTAQGTTKHTGDIVAAKNILFQGKKSNVVVQFDDSDDDDKGVTSGRNTSKSKDEEENDEDVAEPSEQRLHLSTLPKKRRVMASTSVMQEVGSPSSIRMYTGPPPDEGIFDTTGLVLRRNPWTEEETAALLSGMDKYGLGKWVSIKQEYGYILRNRTTVQLKDKYRNMKKNGELPDRYLVA